MRTDLGFGLDPRLSFFVGEAEKFEDRRLIRIVRPRVVANHVERLAIDVVLVPAAEDLVGAALEEQPHHVEVPVDRRVGESGAGRPLRVDVRALVVDEQLGDGETPFAQTDKLCILKI